MTSNADDAPGSVSFHRIDTPQTPGRFVTGIAIDPKDPNHAWISYTGYNAYTPTTPGHVFEVHYDPTTHKATFHDRSYNLGDQPITGIVLVPSSHGTAKGGFGSAGGDIYVSTDFGVSKLSNGSTKWVSTRRRGLPAVATYGLTYWGPMLPGLRGHPRPRGPTSSGWAREVGEGFSPETGWWRPSGG